MRRVVLVTSHFPPSNLVGVHRARIWSQFLPEFGWKPTILTSHWRHYEERLDWGLMKLIDPDLDVVHTKAVGTKPIRVLGNMALRAMWWTRRALDKLIIQDQIDFVHIIVPDHFSALLGPRVFTKHGVPYGIDYSDPWVYASPRSKTLFSKAWVSCCLSFVCEPWAIRHARLITGVAPLYYEDVFERNPGLKEQVTTAAIPMVNSERDFDALESGFTPADQLFDPDDGNFHLVYAGSMPPMGHPVLDRFLTAVKEFIDEDEDGARLRITFVGTGSSPDDPDGHNVDAVARRHNLSGHVFEHPTRIAYLDVLWHLKAASGILILGSTVRHYTPSKIFQAVQSENPVLALLHRDSTGAKFIDERSAGHVVDVPDDGSFDIGETKRALKKLMRSTHLCAANRHGDCSADSARENARRLAEAMESACRT